jgi:hypothetical protein
MFNFGSGFGDWISFELRSLYPEEKILRYSLDERLDGLQSRSCRDGN